MKDRAFISIGSNLGNRVSNVERAVGMLPRLCRGSKVLKSSSLYETSPWGVTDQPPFINCVIEIETGLAPLKLLEGLKAVETEMGREPSARWDPRLIDLDIVFYGDRVMDEEALIIPHPHAHRRAFVMVPMGEIAPEFTHPVLEEKAEELARTLTEEGEGDEEIKKLGEL
ncbi:MAG: 2-amino-4-hydroxy-6-hydroxymethyldihydropteridine diphosphokinase [Thermodesulfobacteriota bacterium]